MWLVQADGTLFDSYPGQRESRQAPTGPVRGLLKVPEDLGPQRWRHDGPHGAFLPGARPSAIGFHSIPVRPNGTPLQTEEELGQFRSIGCVRQRNDKAEQLYEWAPIGTPVIVLA